MVKVARGQNLSVSPLVVSLHLEEYPRYERVYSSDGIARNVGGATALLSASALSYDEADQVFEQWGLSLYTPAAEVTVQLPDLYRIPTKFYGVAELDLYKAEGGWWSNFQIKLSGLVPVWL